MNKKENGELNLKALTVSLLIALISLTIMICKPSAVWMSISTSMLASAAVLILTTLLVDRVPVDPLDKWGIEAMYPSRQMMNADCDSKLKKAKKQIDVIAFGLKHFREEVDTEALLKKGVNFRIITMDPESQFISQREKEEGKSAGYIKGDIEQLMKWAESLNQKTYRGKIEIKGYSCMTLDFYWRVDDSLFWGPYWYDTDSQATISFCYKSGEAFDTYAQYFEKLWNDDSLMRSLVRIKKK